MNIKLLITSRLGSLGLIAAAAFFMGFPASAASWEGLDEIGSLDRIVSSSFEHQGACKVDNGHLQMPDLLFTGKAKRDDKKGRDRGRTGLKEDALPDELLISGKIKRDDHKGRDRGRTGFIEKAISNEHLMAREAEPGDDKRGRGRGKDHFIA